MTSKRANLQRSIVIGVLAIASFLGAAALTVAGGEATVAAPPITVGVDADPTGNSATSLGTIDDCKEVAEGQSFDIDIYIQDVSDLGGFAFRLTYEPSILTVTARDPGFFLGPGGMEVGDLLPDRDGNWYYGYAGSTDSGSGVLMRVTLEAVGTGISPLLLQGVELSDPIGMPFQAEYTVGAFMAVGESCSEAPRPSPSPRETVTPVAPQLTPTPAATPTPAPIGYAGGVEEEDTDDGFPWVAVYAGIGAGVVALVALGLFVGLVRRR